MKFIITENKIQKVAFKFMNSLFSPDQLEIVMSEKYPNLIFYKKNGVVVMEQDKISKNFYFDYDEIWSIFESLFGMKFEQIQDVIRYWLEETLKLKGYTPEISQQQLNIRWKRLSN
jgi:hypothetical protein